MQFLPSTWAAYRNAWRALAARRPARYPHMCLVHGCITDDFDAIAAAAEYLHQLGADSTLGQVTFAALVRYKGTPPASIPYARETLAFAQQLRSENTTSTGVPIQVCGGRRIADRLIAVAGEIAGGANPVLLRGWAPHTRTALARRLLSRREQQLHLRQRV